MALDEEALEVVASGGSVDLEKWPNIAAPLLERLEYIVYNIFPMPKAPQRTFDEHLFASQTTDTTTAPPGSSNKENAAPTDPPHPQAPAPPTSERVSESQLQSSTQQSGDSLPAPLAFLLNSIRSAIQSFFMEKPPHTIQRLAELILRPTAHYKTLPAYLRAVDRVVSVTSAVDVFPFNPSAHTGSQPNGLLHPTNSAGAYFAPDYATGLGSDESLGGALLTPIPWLNNASYEGDEGNVSHGVPVPTQPETDPGVTSTIENPDTADGEGPVQRTSASPPAESPDEVPHARGPPVVGVEDLGLQDGKGVEMNLGNEGTEGGTANPDASEGSKGESTTEAAQVVSGLTAADRDGDIALEDPSPQEKTKAEETTAAADEAKTESGDSTKTVDAKK